VRWLRGPPLGAFGFTKTCRIARRAALVHRSGLWSMTVTVPLLTLMVLLVAFTAEIGWLCRC
jgi:hypothetical protein